VIGEILTVSDGPTETAELNDSATATYRRIHGELYDPFVDDHSSP
jgi:hypothetical protein